MKVGVFDMGGSGWTGGITYLRNLGYAVKTTLPERLNLVLVRKLQAGQREKDWVSEYFDGAIEVAPFGHSRQGLEFVRKVISVLAGGDILNARRFEKVFRSEGIEVLFGSGLSNKFRLPSVGWFPDFQHVDLPEFYSRREILVRNFLVKRMARNCTRMVFSSEHAKRCYQKIHPTYAAKARVLHFVAHLQDTARIGNPAYVLQKHRIPEKFIYLPNQLWMHKNHLTAFRAVKALAERNVLVNLVCSGSLATNARYPAHKDEVFGFIQANGLSDRIFMLGMVDFADVYSLIRQSICVLNPSLYEGWSTTVEETKTIGKPMILSNIEVHREQNPPESTFFEPKNERMLADAMEKAWRLYPAGPNQRMEESASQAYPGRLKQFAQTFADVCQEAAGSYPDQS